MQVSPEATGVPLGRDSHVPNMTYAYDINARGGRVLSTVKVDDIAGTLVAKSKIMGAGYICTVATGALISTVTGGTITGTDMYGQRISEVVGAGDPSTIAFATVVSGPTDMVWVEQFGLPYLYASGGASGLTFTAAAADEDARGTFVVDGGVTGPADIILDYIADQTNLMGVAYAVRFASAALDSDPIVATGTIDDDGLCTLIVPVPTDLNAAITVVWGDGITTNETAHASTPVVHTMTDVWMSKYAATIDAASVDKLTAVNFESNATPGVYVNYTGLPA